MELRDFSDRSPEQQTTYSNDPIMDVGPNPNSGSNDSLRFRIDKTAPKGAAINGRRCNLDCIWCHNDYFSNGKFTSISNEEILRIVSAVIRSSHSPKAVARIAGNGEPTLSGEKELGNLIMTLHEIHEMDRVSMTSNGVLLKPMLPYLVDCGLNSITISLNSLSAGRFKYYSGRNNFDEVLKTLNAASKMAIELKINLIYTKLIKDEIQKLEELSSELGGVPIKIFDLLPNENTRNIHLPLNALKVDLKKRSASHIASSHPYQQDTFVMPNGAVIIIKNAEQENPCPNTNCLFRSKCLEGCRHSVRIGLDGSIQPCGVRTDNRLKCMNRFPTDKEIHDALMSGGKLTSR